MKLFAAGIIALAAAQKKNNYNNNNNNNNGNNNNSNNNSGYGTGYGDPHFMVQTTGQEPICFDYSPAMEVPMTLINDPVSSVVVTTKTSSRTQTGGTFMTEIRIMSPSGAIVTLTNEAITAEGGELDENEKLGRYQIADVICKKIQSEEKLQYHCEIENGPQFNIRSHHNHKTLAFAVTDTTGLSDKTRGVIGRFVKPDGYAIIPDQKEGAVIVSEGQQYHALKHKFHHQEDCWTMKKSTVEHLFSS